MQRSGLINLGGLARIKYGRQAVSLLGLGTYEGQVVASHAWDGPIEKLDVPPAHEGSIEKFFHETARSLSCNQFYIDLRSADLDLEPELREVKGHRAIGVVYDPAHERWGNYVPTILSKRYDAFLFIDRTNALDPLILPFDTSELPETWPLGS
jgi:erythromycin esterase-like protein